MRHVKCLSALAWVGVAAGCVEAPAPAPDPMEAMSFACIRAVEMETNNHDVVVLGADPRSGTWELTLEVGGTGIWSCETSQSGIVSSVTYLGSDGASVA